MLDDETTEDDGVASAWRITAPRPGIELDRSRAAAAEALFGDQSKVRVGRYELGERIGFGGMGVVYRAHDPDLDRDVALKLVQPARLQGAPAWAREQLRGEARALAQLNSPRIVQILDVGDHEEQLFLAMEFVEGTTLDQWLRTRAPSMSEIVDLFIEAGLGLVDAHAAGLVHRDFKPTNVLVSVTGSAHLIDFGLASVSGRPQDSAPGAGTPAYMAPETERGDEPTARSDQYSFCVALAEALGLRPAPFGESGGRVPRAVQQVIERGLAPVPWDRWASMKDLVDALQQAHRSRSRRWLAGAAFVSVVAALVATVPGAGPEPLRARGLSADLRSEPAMARSLLDRGQALRAQNRPTEALDALSRAAFLARRLDQDETSAKAALAAVELVGVEQSDIDAGRQWARHAVAAIEAAGSPRKLTTRLELALGRLEARDGHSEEARTHFEKALAGRITLGATADKIAMIHNDLGRTYVSTREFDTAAEHLEKARRLWDSVAHPDVANAWINLGVLAAEQGQHHASQTAYERALAVLEKTYGPHDPRLAMPSINLGNTLYKLGHYSDAKAQLGRALGIYETMSEQRGMPHPNLGNAHTGLGNIAADVGDHERAWHHHQAALDAWQASLGPNHPLISIAASNGAEQARQLGRLAEAEALTERSLELRRAQYGAHDSRLAFPLTTLGRIWLDQGRHDDAIAALQRAAELRAADENVDPRMRATTAYSLAKAYWARGDRSEALVQAEAAMRDFAGPWAYAEEDVAMVKHWVDRHFEPKI